MKNSMLVNTSFTIRGVDGNDITVGETTERDTVVLCLQQNDDHARLATIRLTAHHWLALCDLRYKLSVHESEEMAAAEVSAAPKGGGDA